MSSNRLKMMKLRNKTRQDELSERIAESRRQGDEEGAVEYQRQLSEMRIGKPATKSNGDSGYQPARVIKRGDESYQPAQVIRKK